MRPERHAAAQPTDGRRLLAAVLSGVIPGLGQAANGRTRAAAILLVPSLIVLLVAGLTIATSPSTMLLARAIVPDTLRTLLILDVVVLVWRLVAVLHAFADRRYPPRPGRSGAVGLAIIVALVALPHGIAGLYGANAFTTFEKVFSGTAGVPVGTGDEFRIIQALAVRPDDRLADTIGRQRPEQVQGAGDLVAQPRQRGQSREEVAAHRRDQHRTGAILDLDGDA